MYHFINIFFNQIKVKTNFDVNMSKCSPICASGLPIVWPCEQNVTKCYKNLMYGFAAAYFRSNQAHFPNCPVDKRGQTFEIMPSTVYSYFTFDRQLKKGQHQSNIELYETLEFLLCFSVTYFCFLCMLMKMGGFYQYTQ